MNKCSAGTLTLSPFVVVVVFGVFVVFIAVVVGTSVGGLHTKLLSSSVPLEAYVRKLTFAAGT